jgi:hypothetical protein
MKRVQIAGLIVLLLACAAQAQVTTFSYSQTDATTGSGTIAGFVYDNGGGPITFGPTPMPSAVVINPGTGAFVGKQTVSAGNSNEGNVMPGIVWSGSVTATGTRGSDVYTIQIPLKFAPKVTQSPDTNDYTWRVIFGDDPAGGNDVVSTASPRFMMLYSRDEVVDATETPNTFQRYTQQNNAFVVGPDSIINTDTTTTAIKDATDSGNPAGTDAAGRDLAFYFGWRDAGTFAPQVIFVDDMTVGGILNADPTTLVPEPGSLMALAGVAVVGLIRRRRA